MEVPSLASTFSFENSVLEYLPLQNSDAAGFGSAEYEVVVDSSEYFQLSVAGPGVADLRLTLVSPSSNQIPLDGGVAEVFEMGDSGGAVVSTLTWKFEAPEQGVWLLQVSGPSEGVAVFYYNYGGQAVEGTLTGLGTTTGTPVGMQVRLAPPHAPQAHDPQAHDPAHILDAQLTVVFPDGSQTTVAMQDDGLHSDGAANDGTWGATLGAAQPGLYVARATVFAQGEQVLARTAELPFAVVDNTVVVEAQATGYLRDERVVVEVPAVLSGRYRAYAEVWAQDVAVAWASAVVTDTLRLEVDADWLARAGATPPLTLRTLTLQDLATGVPLASLTDIPVTMSAQHTKLLHHHAITKNVTEITERMRFGVRPAHIRRPEEVGEEDLPTLLSHGYCAGVNPWEHTAHVWSDPAYFLDANANRNNDDFALRLHDFAEAQGIADRWVGIGHSQGGIALAHLYNYYWTGLDASPGRRIQTVGTPWQGNSVAGAMASLGAWFGVGCGGNADLARPGAQLWLAGISPATRDQVYYFTTTYALNSWFGDYCNLAANAFLQWPNDGVSEYEYAQLPGGHHVSNTEKQCHTTEMGYTAQYFDEHRNSQMNSNAKK